MAPNATPRANKSAVAACEDQPPRSGLVQALSAILFLYREVLGIDLPWLNDINRPAHKRRIPSVLTKDEVAALNGHAL